MNNLHNIRVKNNLEIKELVEDINKNLVLNMKCIIFGNGKMVKMNPKWKMHLC